MDTQKEFDELSELIVIDKEFNINNNRFRTVEAPITSVQVWSYNYIQLLVLNTI